MYVPRNLARLGATVGAAGLLTIGLAPPVSAHVTVTPSVTAAGASAVLTFATSHGCEGSPTTGITIQVPEEILSVSPTRNPQWEVEKTIEELDEPVEDAHGNSVTERVAEVTYRAVEPLLDGYRDTFELSLTLPDTPGETLAFPVIQTCEKGENPWTEVPAEGQDPEQLEFPAPAVTITEATDEDHHGADATVSESDAATEPEADGSDDSDALGLVGLTVGAVGVILGGIALARTRRQA